MKYPRNDRRCNDNLLPPPPDPSHSAETKITSSHSVWCCLTISQNSTIGETEGRTVCIVITDPDRNKRSEWFSKDVKLLWCCPHQLNPLSSSPRKEYAKEIQLQEIVVASERKWEVVPGPSKAEILTRANLRKEPPQTVCAGCSSPQRKSPNPCERHREETVALEL